MDLIQEGNIGLMKAVDKFEYEEDISSQLMQLDGSDKQLQRSIADQARTIRILCT